jgi:hypothetical protein
MKAIVYSLFGYNKEKHPDCFPFASYLRGVSINTRLARLVYPEWKIILEIDRESYEAYQKYFDAMPIEIEVNDPMPLTKSMLWRLKPAFHTEGGKWKYTHILCRDLDSPVTYREAQAVKYWINRDKAIHCITDSISHNLPMLGGMIGVRPDYFSDRMGVIEWNDLIAKEPQEWSRKGADQTFLNNVIYPVFSRHGKDSVTEHFLKGMPNSYLSDCNMTIQDLELEGVPHEYKCTNDCAVHIGQSGWNETPTLKIFEKYEDKFTDIIEAEKQYPLIFFWNNK